MTDAMDEIMDEDLDAELAELEAGQEDGSPEPDPADKAADVKVDHEPAPEDDLAAKVDALTKEKTGVYREMITERTKRQELSAKMEAFEKTLAEIRESRKASGKETEEPVKPKISGIPVKFDDDGNPYIDPSDLKGFQPEEIKAVKAEVAHMKNVGQSQELDRRNQDVISTVMAKDDRYPEAVQTLNTAYQYLDAKTAEVMAKHGLTLNTTNIEHVMGLLENEFGEDFESQFPGLSIDDVIEAMLPSGNGLYNGRKVHKALKSIAASMVPKSTSGQQKLNNLKLMASKPSNLSTTRNQKGTTGKTLSDIADMGVDDIMNMSDADFKKIERALMGAGG